MLLAYAPLTKRRLTLRSDTSFERTASGVGDAREFDIVIVGKDRWSDASSKRRS